MKFGEREEMLELVKVTAAGTWIDNIWMGVPFQRPAHHASSSSPTLSCLEAIVASAQQDRTGFTDKALHSSPSGT